MYKIRGWTQEKPLIQFTLTFNFSETIELKLSQGNELSNILKKYYENEPNILLMEYRKLPKEIQINRGLIYSNKEKTSNFTIGKNFVEYNFTEYSNWREISDQIIEILFALKDSYKLKSINQIRFLYIDKFELKNEGNVINDNFNVKIEFPDDFDLLFHDFTFGYILEDTDDGKLIHRLRGRSKNKSSQMINYVLENDFIGKKPYVIDSKQQILEVLTKIHDNIIHKFVSLVKDKVGSKYGLTLENES